MNVAPLLDAAPRRRGGGLWTGALLLLLVPPAFATRQRPLSLAEMTRGATTIVVGRVTDVRVGAHPRHPDLTVTRVTLRISETWKGARTPVLTFMQIGDAAATPLARKRGETAFGAERFPDLPTYTPGEEVVLFLRRPSGSGLTSPAALHAGKWSVDRNPRTGTAVLRRIPRTLMRGSSTQAPVGPEAGPPGPHPDNAVTLEAARARVLGLVRTEGARQ